MFDSILSQYTGVELLGEGGQKKVFKVTHPTYGVVVLKLGTAKTKNSMERVRREFDALNRISSPFFPKTFEFNELNEDRFMIIEEYIDALPLSFQMYEGDIKNKIFDTILKITKGLNVLWANQIVHRDVKPDNILVRDEHVYIIDLGIARLLEMESITHTGAFLGTRAYISPEQARDAKRVDFRSDQYNIGIIAGQMFLGGIHPFDPSLVGGTSYIENILTSNWGLEKLKSVADSQSVDIISKLLDPQPYGRFRKPELLLAALTKIVGGFND